MSNKPASWNRLDNAAKIFPPTSNKQDTKVFRMSCQLKEYADAQILQQALDQTMEFFPFFRSVLKHGLFWYYFEDSNLTPFVHEDDRSPCSPLYDPNSRNLLFEVTYYKTRINLEVYHALTDGTGAIQFFRTLLCHYLVLKYPDQITEPPLLDYDASYFQKSEDSFLKYYNPKKEAKRSKSVKSYQIHGVRLSEGRLKIIEGIMPVKDALALAKSYGTTLTILLTSAFLLAISQEMALRSRKKPIVLSVPVNLRNYFDSETARNFFGVINVGYTFTNPDTKLEEVIPHIKAAFERELTHEQLSERMNALSKAEHNYFTRAIPLVLKDIILRIANYSAQRSSVGSISNLGRINMPDVVKPFIQRFGCFISTDKLQAVVCTFDQELTVSFTSAFRATDVQKNFFRILSSAGIPVQIQSNLLVEEE